MEKITSHDGTPIAFQRRGAGPPLVLVAGAGGANPLAWTAVSLLAEHFTVYAVDRRGHGESGDGPAYALEREFEDIAAVVDSIPEPVNLLGHSFGGLCALEAARLTRDLRRLVLYEPLSVPLPGKPLYPPGFLDRLEGLLQAGDLEGVLAAHYVENVGMTHSEFEGMRSSPAWPARLATAQTLPRELRAEEGYQLDPQRFQDLGTSTLILEGSDSPQVIKAGVEVIHAALPNRRVVVLPGQGHIAMYTAPDLFVQEVLTFLSEPG